MDNDFDRFLASALAPPDRLPDRRFVAAVQMRVQLEDRLAAQRRALFANLLKQLLALLAVTASIWVVTRAEPVGRLLAEEPALAAAILLTVFSLAVALFSWRSGSGGEAVAGI